MEFYQARRLDVGRVHTSWPVDDQIGATIVSAVVDRCSLAHVGKSGDNQRQLARKQETRRAWMRRGTHLPLSRERPMSAGNRLAGVQGACREAGFTQGVIDQERKEPGGKVVNTEGKMSPSNWWALVEG